MSRSMLSPVPALALGVSSLPLTRTKHPGSPMLTLVQRISGAPAGVPRLCGRR